MRILFYKPEGNNGFMSTWPLHHYVDELNRIGHDTHIFDPVVKLNRIGNISEYSEMLIDEIKLLLKKYKIDMFFTAASDKTISKDAVIHIKRLGIPTVLMHCDDLSVPFIIKKIASGFDLIWATSRENIDILNSYGANVIMMPYAANPYKFRPVSIEEKRYVGFIGSVNGARRYYIRHLTEDSINMNIFGNNKNQTDDSDNPLFRAVKNIGYSLPFTSQQLMIKTGRKIIAGALKKSIFDSLGLRIESKPLEEPQYYSGPAFSEMGKYYSEMAISYGSIEYANTYVLKTPLMCIHLREFEAPMCGAVHIVNRTPELLEYFEEDKEMLFYSSKEELSEKIKYYLHPKRDAIRSKIRQAARRRSVEKHSWEIRFKNIWQNLGLSRSEMEPKL
jgi:hypothetical protein